MHFVQHLLVAMVLVCPIVLVFSTKVQQCRSPDGRFSGEPVTVSNCTEPPCKLKRRSKPSFSIVLKPERNIKSLTNNVFARIGGIPFPFLGVDGTSACDNIFKPDGSKHGCPLKKGETYLYRNAFTVLDAYPKIQLVVRWFLSDESNKNLICFELPARITS